MLAKLLPIGAAQRRNSLSPGRQPGVSSCSETKRRRRDTVTESFAPMGLDLRSTRVPGLTPGAWSLDIYATLNAREIASDWSRIAARERSPGRQPRGLFV